uniref:Calcium-dependent protein kinase n=1 Tax=Tetraselmis sp. GSL018 TaxID=582737 RepID=A0A061QXI5_9CHLO|eukprot:CAMPEP_0177604456 /NCGR_PEP_ID=MMETSP0419_2-20121207/16127_1 /TAXON_ID=582737 /ORGANISM="Tetraselmis sp., Strain GSL018" /LENGTH=529 /DNA_ID=CAMNT_0019098439 /DNA_START=355 /DNA_END=1944 /DNA_ORIENTATION=+
MKLDSHPPAVATVEPPQVSNKQFEKIRKFRFLKRVKKVMQAIVQELHDVKRTNLSAVALKVQKTHHLLGIEYKDLSDLYVKGHTLGRGGFAQVYEVVEHSSNFGFACKEINKEKLLSSGMERVLRKEITTMGCMRGSRSAVQLHDVLEDETNVYVVMDLCEGGDSRRGIAQRLTKDGCFTEADAAAMMRRMLAAVGSCHERGVIHRDLKFDNFLWTQKGARGELKLSDFGLAAFWAPGDAPIRERCGTAPFMAPEVWSGWGYTAAADVWALGIMLAILLAGDSPFEFQDKKQCAEAACTQQIDWEISPWSLLSLSGRDLLSRMLNKNPLERITVAEVQQHPWLIEGGAAPRTSVAMGMATCMRKLGDIGCLHQAALRLTAKDIMETERAAAFRKAFELCDLDRDGVIGEEELQKALKSLYNEVTDIELKAFVSSFDVLNEGKIGMTEFTAALLYFRSKEDEVKLLKESFPFFDCDNDGMITKTELQQALRRADMAPREIAGLYNALDINRDGFVSPFEFDQFWQRCIEL